MCARWMDGIIKRGPAILNDHMQFKVPLEHHMPRVNNDPEFNKTNHALVAYVAIV